MADSFLLGAQFVSRVRSVVARVEGSASTGESSQQGPVRFEEATPPVPQFRVGTFSGVWNKTETKTVTFLGSTSTATATNLFADVNSANSANVSCAVAMDRGTWYLIATEC